MQIPDSWISILSPILELGPFSADDTFVISCSFLVSISSIILICGQKAKVNMNMNDLYPSNGLSNRPVDSSAKVSIDDTQNTNCFKNGYSLWGSQTLMGPRTISMDGGNGKNGYENLPKFGLGFDPSNKSRSDLSAGALLGPYSKPFADVSNSKSLNGTLPQVFNRSIKRPAWLGSNWNHHNASLAHFLHFPHDANNNEIESSLPNWPPHSLGSFTSQPSLSSSRPRVENYVVTRKSGEKVYKTKAAYAKSTSAQILKPPADPPKRIHVSNIPFWMTENDLLFLFRDFGTVQEVQVITNEKGSKVSA